MDAYYKDLAEGVKFLLQKNEAFTQIFCQGLAQGD